MANFQVNEKCTGCLACVQSCPAKALSHEDQDGRRTLLHNPLVCARCGHCWRICPEGAIEFERFLQGDWERVISMDLVRCDLCGEAVYTARFQGAVSDRLKEDVKALCPRHRSSAALTVWHRALATGKPLEEAQK